MPRYADIDKFLDIIHQHDYPLVDRLNSIDNGMFTIGIEQAIAEAENADVVEVVRCKDCKHRNPYGWKCLRDNLWHDEDDFCSYGEREEN